MPAGYYGVSVKDSHSIEQRAEITLTEPERLQVTTTSSSFPNGHNISCFECSNGSIQTVVTKGTAPYSFAWTDGPSTAQNRYSLGPQEYAVIVTDANGCVDRASVRLSQPERSDWTMSGNTGTNPATQFIGTTDNKDLVFKSNNTEGLRLKADGGIQLKGNLSGAGILQRAGDGSLSLLTDAPASLCGYGLYPFWKTNGNAFALCPDATVAPRLGTLEGLPLDLITNDQLRLRVTAAGQVGIGVVSPLGDLHVHHAGTAKLVLSTTTGQASLWAQNSTFGYALATDADGKGHLLGNVNAPTALLTFLPNGKVGVGTEPPSNWSDYQLYVGGGIAARDVKVTAGNWPDYVFSDDHQLMPLGELRAFLARHRHLPGIPTAQEVECNEGVEVGDLQTRLLKVVEEQALYILQLEKRITALEADKL